MAPYSPFRRLTRGLVWITILLAAFATWQATRWSIKESHFVAVNDPLDYLRALAPDMSQQPLSWAPKSMPRAINQIAYSAFADSVRQIFGTVPLSYYPSRTLEGGWQPQGDEIVLSTRAVDTLDIRHTLIHEFAHHAASLFGATAPNLFAPDSVTTQSVYAARSRSEHGAEAAAFAMGFLQLASRPIDSHALAAALDTLDYLVPATRSWVNVLLSHPIYASHPLNTGSLSLPGVHSTKPPWSWSRMATEKASYPRRLINIMVMSPGIQSPLLSPIARLWDR